MDFAIIETGGKQYKFVPNTEVVVEKLSNTVGEKVVFDKVLMIVDGEDVKLGDPYLKNTTLEAEVLSQDKTKKIHVLRFRAKSRTRRHYGHRQQVTKVSIKTSKQSVNTDKKKAVAKSAQKIKSVKKVSKTAKKSVAQKSTTKAK